MDGNSSLDNSVENIAEEFVQGSQDSSAITSPPSIGTITRRETVVVVFDSEKVVRRRNRIVQDLNVKTVTDQQLFISSSAAILEAVAEAVAVPRCAIRAAASRIAINATTTGHDLVKDDTRSRELSIDTAICSVVAREIGVDAAIIEPKSQDFTAASMGEQDTTTACAEG
ncbi:hypothetical protein ACH5RR_001377 [Cinchona calisaya]|uniref:Uncharacterized protein n=1 Tax=Cinchona calisaya TaxID=153742 RepID=A0ABD3B3U7_9GENT